MCAANLHDLGGFSLWSGLASVAKFLIQMWPARLPECITARSPLNSCVCVLLYNTGYQVAGVHCQARICSYAAGHASSGLGRA